MSEILFPTNSKHSGVCCLSSLNLYKYEEWKDSDVVFLSILFLDAVMEEFIQKASEIKEMQAAINFAKKSRALGLGVMGLHSLMQAKMIPYESLQAKLLCRVIFSKIKNDSIFASKFLGEYLGVPEWCQGSGRRNLTLTTIPPTRSSSVLAGGMSEGCQPYVSNAFLNQSAKGTLDQKSPEFIKYLESIGQLNDEVLKSVSDKNGSCQHLEFIPDDVKEVFKTRFEINQMALVELTALIQEYIEQGISCNLSFPSSAPAKFIYDVHVRAWELGLKSLYYLKSKSVLEIGNNLFTNECLSCQA